PFFLTFPIQGKPVEFKTYFRGKMREHLWGVLGGVVWMVGGLASYVAAAAPAQAHAGTGVSFALAHGGILVSAIWGLLVWREFGGATGRVKLLLLGMFVLFAAGLTLVAIAPQYGK